MVELVGKRSRFGVDEFLRQVKGETMFADLLKTYDVNGPPVTLDQTQHKLDRLIQAIKRAVAAGRPRLVVTPAGEKDLFDFRLEWQREPRWPDGMFEIRAWPITQHAERGQMVGKSITFPRLSYAGLTPLIAFSVAVKIEKAERETAFVLNLPLDGAPADRQDRVVRSLIENRDQLLRYILFLLASGDEEAASSGDLQKLLQPQGGGSKFAAQNPYLLETMLRALHRSPAQLERVASLLEVLRKQPGSSELLSDDFQKIWGPIWVTAQEVIAE
jgi:hypothetical protein